jgi:hypothetical protein
VGRRTDFGAPEGRGITGVGRLQQHDLGGVVH